MIFTIDIGNSNIVIGLMDAEKNLVFSGRIRSDLQKTKEEFQKELQNLFHDTCPIMPSQAEGVILSSVVPMLTSIIRDAMANLTGRRPIVVGQDIATGLHIKMDHPKRVGTDLLVDAVAAASEHPGTIAIFDLGTATTCSIVDGNQTYQGTIIIPGVQISQKALSEKAAQLPHIRFDHPGRLIGKNTVESMQSGVIYGTAAMIDGLVERLEDELVEPITVIATGGIAGAIVPYCKRKVIYDPELLLKGLWYIYYKTYR